ncbi:sugar phosphate isomerase/epimerase family protein [Pirellulimonas nuda]|nr:sugar phosphate isomerase/epimerase family protein [Pirellulimonas nuda]
MPSPIGTSTPVHPPTEPTGPAVSRRGFVQRLSAASLLGAGWTVVPRRVAAAPTAPAADSNKGRIFKSVKWGMIAIEGPAETTTLDRFRLCKELGYDGMELVSPEGPSAAEVRAASEATGMPVHGLVDMKHWDVRLSSPDPKVRDQGREFFEQSLRDCHAYGGSSVLLVPGNVGGADETHDDVWRRSIEQIRLTLPLASRLGVRVLIENVWNGFCENPDEARDYLDEIDSPWVGAYFDIGNVRKFAPSEEWVRTLGPRIVKLDVKDWGASSGFCKIGDGDVNWPAVRQALAEIGFTGWCTAEVEGGGRERLADIAQRMNKVLALA